MGRPALSITEIKRRVAEEWGALTAIQRHHYPRILRGQCVGCNYPPKPGRRRCEVCALNNLDNVLKSKTKLREEVSDG